MSNSIIYDPDPDRPVTALFASKEDAVRATWRYKGRKGYRTQVLLREVRAGGVSCVVWAAIVKATRKPAEEVTS